MPKLLVIGCGANIHPVHVTLPGWHEITIDKDWRVYPTICGDITNPGFIGLLKTLCLHRFDCVLFENFTYYVLSDELIQLMVMNMVDHFLKTPGWVRISTGGYGTTMIHQIRRLFARWGYRQLYHPLHPLTDVGNRLHLDVSDENLRRYNVTFAKVGGARRTSATI